MVAAAVALATVLALALATAAVAGKRQRFSLSRRPLSSPPPKLLDRPFRLRVKEVGNERNGPLPKPYLEVEALGDIREILGSLTFDVVCEALEWRLDDLVGRAESGGAVRRFGGSAVGWE